MAEERVTKPSPPRTVTQEIDMSRSAADMNAVPSKPPSVPPGSELPRVSENMMFMFRFEGQDRKLEELGTRLASLEQAVQRLAKTEDEVEREKRRVREELKYEFGQAVDSVKRTFGETIERLAPDLKQIKELVPLNSEQVELLREAAKERIERKLRETIALEKKAEDDRLRLEAETKAQAERARLEKETADRLIAIRERRDYVLKWIAAIAGLLTTLSVALATIFKK